jgi:3'(2'), 5'-bisphosphate nucleotidase
MHGRRIRRVGGRHGEDASVADMAGSSVLERNDDEGEAFPNDDGELAGIIAQRAGRHLVELQKLRAPIKTEADGKSLGVEGDATANQMIIEYLKRARPNDSILSEESADDLARLNAERVWIVDPLDGTREYSRPPRDDWAVHVALWTRTNTTNRCLRAGAVAIPGRDELFTTSMALHVAERKPDATIRIIASASREQPEAEAVARQLKGILLRVGSAGAKAMMVLRGEADVYVHSGGQYEWDSAAPVAVMQQAGFVATRLDGSTIEYNQENTYLPDLLICRPDLVDFVRAALS